MKRIFTFIIILLALTGCTAFQVQTLESAATAIPQAGLPNPASLYCTQNGNKSEIRTSADGSQTGVCIFPDGSTCDEWAYFRGECGPAAKDTSDEVVDWQGVIKSTEPGGQYDDYFERQDQGGAITFGIDSIDPDVKSKIETLRDSGQVVHLYGTILTNMPDYGGSQIQVDRIETD